MIKAELRRTTSAGFPQRMTLFTPQKAKEGRPLLIYVHGFKGFKDWGFIPFAGEFFAEKGYHFLTFNFSHNGVGEDLLEFTELDKFRNNTYSMELNETLEVAEMAALQGINGSQPFEQIGLIGHSRGGGIALLAASESPYIKAVTTWAAVSGFNLPSLAVVDRWRKTGSLEVINSRTGQVFHMGLDILADVENNAARLDVGAAVARCKKPICIIHGDEDTSVPISHASKIYEADEWGKVELHIISGADHVFGVKHPFAGNTPEFGEVLEYTLKFFDNKF
ncbi:MAG: prolyl oligopeptidase family serine peptidase [Bacteroidia bacterium]|nr:prolyl oligopeptidase family serine peptidase [Bacteroidia bacterium]